MLPFRHYAGCLLIHFALAIPLLLTGCNSSSSDSTDNGAIPSQTPESEIPLEANDVEYQEFAREGESLQLLYPTTWRFVSDSSPEVLGSFMTQPESDQDQFLEGLFIFELSLDEIENDEELTNIDIINVRDTIVSGIEVSEITFDAEIPDIPLDLRFMGVELLRNGKSYVLLYAAERHKFDRYVNIVRHMMHSTSIGLEIADINVRGSGDYPQHSQVIFDGQNYLVVYCDIHEEPMDDFSSRTITYSTLFGILMSETGNVINQFQITPKKQGNCPEHHFDVGFDQHEFMIISVQDRIEYSFGTSIYATRVSRQGEILNTDPILISRNEENAYHNGRPSVVFDGTNYLVAWESHVGPVYLSPDAGRAIFSALLSPTGELSNRRMLMFKGGIAFHQPIAIARQGSFEVVWHQLIIGDSDDTNMNHFFGQQLSSSGDPTTTEPLELMTVEGDMYSWDLNSNGTTGILSYGLPQYGDEDPGFIGYYYHTYTLQHFHSLSDFSNNTTEPHTLWELDLHRDDVPAVTTQDGLYHFYSYNHEFLVQQDFDPNLGILNDESLIGELWTNNGFGHSEHSRPSVAHGLSDSLVIYDRVNLLRGWLFSAFSSQH